MADRRRLLARPDLAAERLRGTVDAAAFAEPVRHSVVVPVLDLKSGPDSGALATQLVFGEAFDVLDACEGWAFGQAVADGYVGYVSAAGLGPEVAASARVMAISAPVYPEPHFKSVPDMVLPWQSALAGEREGEFLRTARGFVCAQHLEAAGSDWVGTASRLLGVPYLWGGRSSFGLDCSALVQLSLASIGVACPRDSDMQMAELGDAVPDDAPVLRGDLVFWKGHVGIMEDAATLLHANVHHMAVAREPLADAEARIRAKGEGPVLLRKRV